MHRKHVMKVCNILLLSSFWVNSMERSKPCIDEKYIYFQENSSFRAICAQQHQSCKLCGMSSLYYFWWCDYLLDVREMTQMEESVFLALQKHIFHLIDIFVTFSAWIRAFIYCSFIFCESSENKPKYRFYITTISVHFSSSINKYLVCPLLLH